jgi:hypothetical protein
MKSKKHDLLVQQKQQQQPQHQLSPNGEEDPENPYTLDEEDLANFKGTPFVSSRCSVSSVVVHKAMIFIIKKI